MFLKQASTTSRPKTSDVIQRAFSHSFSTQTAMVRNGESMSFIANALQQIQSFRTTRNTNRFRLRWYKHLFKLFRERCNWNFFFESKFGEHIDCNMELTFATVDKKQLRRVG